MKILIVLAHHMSSDCVLGCESIARAKLAIQTFNQGGYKFLVTSGWAYRDDCSTPISDVFEQYIRSNSAIKASEIISESNSRDTVGDAYFLRRLSADYDFSEITVITSDYHVRRASIIFEKILGNVAAIEVLGADTKFRLNSQTLHHEEESIKAFERTFKNANFDSLNSVYHAMTIKHPFYNGDIFAKIEF